MSRKLTKQDREDIEEMKQNFRRSFRGEITPAEVERRGEEIMTRQKKLPKLEEVTV